MEAVAKEYDVIVVGAGPAGSAMALYCHRYGLKTLLLEKDTFPRDKICGDAISGKSMTILKDMGLLERAKQLPGAVVDSITFGSPDHQLVTMPLFGKESEGILPGLVVRRLVFDKFLVDRAREAGVEVLENCVVKGILRKQGSVSGVRVRYRDKLEEQKFHGRIVIGADGFKSIIAREMNIYKHEPEHWVVALRQYYRNVGGVNSSIELHYIDEVQPGYLWIFPVDENRVNVGIGMLHKILKKRRIDLKSALKRAIESPFFRDRFAHAEPLENPMGWNLPVGSKRRINHGDGFMLLGDAAGLIDPFTGEGIGNALYSAREAAQVAREAVEAGDYSAAFLSRYDQRLWDGLGSELAISSKLQRIGRIRFLLNFVINKAARSPEVKNIIMGMMTNDIPKTRFANPLFYVKLLLS